jgi:aspartate-semialdehyde dehydrogenase
MSAKNPIREREQFAQGDGAVDIAIVGATGAVGGVLIDVLEERGFPAGEIRPLASGRSAGRRVSIRGRDVEVQEATPEAFEGIDVVFFAATGALSKSLAPEAVARGAVVIDKSSTWRMDPDVPLVVPEINPESLDSHHGIIACPNCTTIGIVMALEPLRRLAGLRSVVATTFQAVSGAGRDGIDELSAQRDAAPGQVPEPRVFAAPIHGNVVPLCDAPQEGGYTGEELKLLNETRKIFGDPTLAVSMTCVRVPVEVGHSATLLLETERALTPEEARSALDAAPGVVVMDDAARSIFPTPLDVVGRDEVLVGRIRQDLVSDRLWLWQVCDNLRKGAATNAVQIAEALLERKILARGEADG